MPRTKEAFEEMRQKSSNHILQTALKLFSENGYHSTSISMIAKEAGVSAGLMYNYFSSKEELLEKIMNENFQYIYLFIQKRLDLNAASLETSNNANADIDVGKLIDVTFEAISTRKDSWNLLISIMFQPDVSKMAKKMIEKFGAHQENLYLGYFNSKAVQNPTLSAKVLAAIMHGAFLNFAYSGDSEDIRVLRETVIQKLLTDGV